MKKILTFLVFVFTFVSFAFSQQLLKTSNYKTQDNVPNLTSAATTPAGGDYTYCWTLERARDRFGDSVYYYEKSRYVGWYRGGTAYAPGNDYRQTSYLSGETINGNEATWVFDIDTSTNYLIYTYILTSGNAASNCYYKFQRLGESIFADSIRYDMRNNNRARYMKVPGESAVGYGVWVPINLLPVSKGTRSFSVTVGADTLTGFSLIRADAVRILKSDVDGPELEFGRRSYLYFDSLRVEEEFGEVGLGETLDRDFPLYNLGSKDLIVTGVSFVNNTGRFSGESFFPLTIKPGQKANLKIRFRPYQEEFVTDTLLILSNDVQEPSARLPISGTGINYYFIMNGADPNMAEPHYNAPYNSPQDPNRPSYNEGAEGLGSVAPGWMNSGSVSPYNYPIRGGNLKSRVTTLSDGTTITYCEYKFTLPPEKYGNYIMEFSGPFYSSNATSKANCIVYTPFVSDSAAAVFSEESLELDGFWRNIGQKTWSLNGGAPTRVRYTNVAQPDEFLRADLLRVRKIPTDPTITSEYQFKTYYFSGVSSYASERAKDPLKNKKQFDINSTGESLIRIDSIYLARGYYYKILEKMKFPIEVPAVNGKYSFTIEFNPDIIFAGFIDTIYIKTNATASPKMTIRLYGSSMGDQVYADDKDNPTYFYPATPVDFIMASDQANYGKWYKTSGGYNSQQMLGYIYQLKGNPDYPDIAKKNLAYIEWYPDFPLKQGGTAIADSFDVYAVLPIGSSNSNPTAKYIIYEYGGKPTEKIVSQNGLTTTELYLGRYQFMRGGRDSHGSGNIFGHVELFNDTALVTDYYKAVYPNPAKRDSFVTRADAIVFREAAKPGQTIVGEPEIPTEYTLMQNYPNPFNPSTTIKFSIKNLGKVDIIIYDMLGREVRTLINDKLVPGQYSITWNGKNNYGNNVSTGTYFYRIKADNFISIKKMLLIK